jgi:hypothetical protein
MMGAKIRNFASLPDLSLEDLAFPRITSTAACR